MGAPGEQRHDHPQEATECAPPTSRSLLPNEADRRGLKSCLISKNSYVGAAVSHQRMEI